jgi:hypothetical protein
LKAAYNLQIPQSEGFKQDDWHCGRRDHGPEVVLWSYLVEFAAGFGSRAVHRPFGYA